MRVTVRAVELVVAVVVTVTPVMAVVVMTVAVAMAAVAAAVVRSGLLGLLHMACFAWLASGSGRAHSPGHTPETLNCESIVDPEVMQLINWRFQV